MKLGTNTISTVKLGTNQVQKVYLGTNEVWSAVDPDAQAFYDRVTTAGGSLTTTEQTAVNTLVVQMKTDGIWTKMKAIYPMVGASAAACAQNLKSSSFTGTFTSGWTFASTGAKPNGTSAYMDTGLNDSTDLVFNNISTSYYSRTNILSGNAPMFGCSDLTSPYNIYIYAFNNTMALFARNIDMSNVFSTSAQYFITNLTSTGKIFFNGNLVKTEDTTTNVSLNQTLYVGGVRGRLTNARECAFAHIGESLTDAQASNLYTAVQAFQTTLSRNV